RAGAWFEPYLAGLSLALLGAGSLLDASAAPLVPALRSNWLVLHVAVVMLGYAALALSGLAAAACLARRGGRAADRLNGRALGLGYLLLTAGIILGAVWANEAWGSYWSWDPKETWSLLTWLAYTGAIHMRRARGWTGRRLAWLSVLGFSCLLFTYFGVNFLLGGLHSYGR
ncbi:MAG: cytochrome c biogenesis protein CcsA, partial [Elusimicrobia bacterium]|nr:cytochrome c biogenesis protein CcsA [Elusimicrobiota bacterium]